MCGTIQRMGLIFPVLLHLGAFEQIGAPGLKSKPSEIVKMVGSTSKETAPSSLRQTKEAPLFSASD